MRLALGLYFEGTSARKLDALLPLRSSGNVAAAVVLSQKSILNYRVNLMEPLLCAVLGS